MEKHLPWLLPLIFPAVFIGFWCLVSWLLANLGGWARLAQSYRAQPGRRTIGATHFGMASARIGWVNYNNCLILDASPEGLRLAIWPIFPFHPPLWLPREAIQLASVSKVLWIEVARVEVGAQRQKIRLPRKFIAPLALEDAR